MPYSMDFRRAVARAYDECGSSTEVAEQFGCCASWVRRLVQRRRENGSLEPRPHGRRDEQRSYDDADERRIRALIARRPDATLAEVVEALGKPVHAATASRTLARLGLPRKKSPRTPANNSARTSGPRGRAGSSSS
jgi:transposase